MRYCQYLFQKAPQILRKRILRLPIIKTIFWKFVIISLKRSGKPLQLHLGCGSVHLDGYINIDVEDWGGACDLVSDASSLSLFPNESADRIFCHALLEHIPPWDTQKSLLEWHRVLKPHGTIQIEVPDLERIFTDWLIDKTLSEQEAINNIFGGNKSPSKKYSRQDHLTGFTYNRLTKMMEECGFSCFQRLEHPKYNHILVLTARKELSHNATL